MYTNEQPPTGPANGVSTAYRAMDDAVMFYLAHGGPSVARAHVEELSKHLIFYDDCKAAYEAALEKIAEAERQADREAEQRHLEQQRALMAQLMEDMRNSRRPAADDQEDGSRDSVPAVLTTQRAKALMLRLQREGLLNEHLQPQNLSRTEAATLANDVAERLGIAKKWKTFEALWHKRNMRNAFNEALDQRKTLDFRQRLKLLLSEY